MTSINILSFNIKWSYKTISLFFILLILPNFLGMINLATPWGFKIHFFQLAIFIAALIYGPKGGALAGLVGSTYSALIMNNPYIMIGNVILGFFAGLFNKFEWNIIIVVLLAYGIQLPWLIISDYYLMHLPPTFINGLIISLAVSNIIWAIVASYTIKPIKKLLDVKTQF